MIAMVAVASMFASGAGGRTLPGRISAIRAVSPRMSIRGGSLSRVLPPGSFSSLSGATCVSASDCWAVGWFSPRHEGILSEALHWTGSSWSLVPTANPAGTSNGDYNELGSVTCVSSSDCWAVGYSYNPSSGPNRNLILHWNGVAWSPPLLLRSRGILSGVSCVSASDCWATGSYREWPRNEAFHWNGSKWSRVLLPQPAGDAAGNSNGLSGLTCLSSSDCWAVGSDSRGGPAHPGFSNQVLRWNGTIWSPVPTPEPGGFGADALSGVSCSSSSSCWAVGKFSDRGGAQRNQLLRWNGKRWSTFSLARPATNVHPDDLGGIACASPSGCWTVGSIGKNQFHLNEAQRWNGNSWKLVSTPQPGGTKNSDTNVLSAVTCVSGSDCWAVGYSQAHGKPNVNEALHWDGRTWSVASPA